MNMQTVREVKAVILKRGDVVASHGRVNKTVSRVQAMEGNKVRVTWGPESGGQTAIYDANETVMVKK